MPGVSMVVRGLGALICFAAAASVLLLGIQVALAYTGSLDLMIRGPSAAIFVLAAFVLFILAMIAFGLLLRTRYRVSNLMWAALALAITPLPLGAFAFMLGGDEANDPVFRLMLYILLAGYGLYAVALTWFGRRLRAASAANGTLRIAGLCLAGGGGFYLAHALAATVATLHEGYVFPMAALVLMILGGGCVALAETAFGVAFFRRPGAARPGPSV